ncbi:hypothetical protein [Halovulum sp. GXIMD14793]
MFVAIQLLALYRAGLFEYPLDDVYIHMAMASEMARGGYGINSGDLASAASSALYPLLLMPFPDTEAQRLLPLLWNAIAVTISGLLLAECLLRAGLQQMLNGGRAVLLAAFAGIALHIGAVGFTGMENALHTTASLAIVLGWIRFLQGDGIGAALVLGCILAPVLRFEGLALSLASAGGLVLLGQMRAGVLLMFAAAMPVAGFVWFLTAHGIGPLPNSVMAKMDNNNILQHFWGNLQWIPGMVLAAVCLLLVLLVFQSNRSHKVFALVIAASAIAHLLFAKFGWGARYENYIIAASIVGCLYLATQAGSGLRKVAFVDFFACGLVLCVAYLPSLTGRAQFASQAQHLQQAQMARFADELGLPVAVNDIGRVSWANPVYVLDLWGLASREALRLRTSEPAPGWADLLLQHHDVRLMMIYDDWMPAPPASQAIRIAKLRLLTPGGYQGGKTVSFYALRKEDVPMLNQKLRDLANQLPTGAALDLVNTPQTEDPA